ncbi:MAG: GHMP kinase [Flavobacteriaceae bacterium]|nr:GHMP kinase [Flavobacteriaceae bacterium]
MKKEFYSNGKLLITGEYVVLKGAKALALPTKYGQSLTVEKKNAPGIHWTSYDHDGSIWFETEISSAELISEENEGPSVKTQLVRILKAAISLNPNFLKDDFSLKVETHLSFPRNWGLGTSSTLINNIAQWAEVNAFKLLDESFGGSGYDIAAAQTNQSFWYQLKDGNPTFETVNLNWKFTDRLFFIYLNRKQDSKLGIQRFSEVNKTSNETFDAFNELTSKVIDCTNIKEFEKLLENHEEAISKLVQLPKVIEEFTDFHGTLKSLGAWGGDFILATGSEADMDYFRKKGYETIIPFQNMVK